MHRFLSFGLSADDLSVEFNRDALARVMSAKDCGELLPTRCRMSKPAGFLLALLACLLSACATPRWKPEASKRDFAQDQAACVHEIQQPPPRGTTDQQQYEACMNAHGWKLQ